MPKKLTAKLGDDRRKQLDEEIKRAYDADEYDEVLGLYEEYSRLVGGRLSGRDHFRLGYSYAEKGDHDRAIECYQKALDTPGYETPGGAWNNMGISYARKGEHDRAIECYQKALDKPGYETRDKAWWNLGLALRLRGDRASGDYDAALSAFLEAARLLREAGDAAEADRAEAQAEATRLMQSAGAEAAKEQYPALSAALPSSDGPEVYDPLEELQALERETQLVVAQYHARTERDERKHLPESAVVFLKGWSSSEPILAEGSDEEPLQGGGLFIRWEGKGLVVDPGIGFLANFHRSGYLIHDVDAIIATHEHVDHTFDLNALDDLVYAMKRYEDPDRRRFCFLSAGVQAGAKSEESYVRHSPFDGGYADSEHEHAVDRIPGMSVLPFRTEHIDGCKNTFGFVCTMGDEGRQSKVGVTSDTAYFDGLSGRLAGCDVIVANMSNPRSAEYDDPSYLKKGHLGLNGTRRLIAETEAQVYVISEFWAGLGDRRIPLCQKLAYDLKRIDGVTGKCIMPADIGMTIRLGSGKDGAPSLRMACTSCGTPASPRLVDCGEITVVRPDRPYGPIRYLCPDCMRRLTLPSRGGGMVGRG